MTKDLEINPDLFEALIRGMAEHLAASSSSSPPAPPAVDSPPPVGGEAAEEDSQWQLVKLTDVFTIGNYQLLDDDVRFVATFRTVTSDGLRYDDGFKKGLISGQFTCRIPNLRVLRAQGLQFEVRKSALGGFTWKITLETRAVSWAG